MESSSAPSIASKLVGVERDLQKCIAQLEFEYLFEGQPASKGTGRDSLATARSLVEKARLLLAEVRALEERSHAGTARNVQELLDRLVRGIQQVDKLVNRKASRRPSKKHEKKGSEPARRESSGDGSVVEEVDVEDDDDSSVSSAFASRCRSSAANAAEDENEAEDEHEEEVAGEVYSSRSSSSDASSESSEERLFDPGTPGFNDFGGDDVGDNQDAASSDSGDQQSPRNDLDDEEELFSRFTLLRSAPPTAACEIAVTPMRIQSCGSVRAIALMPMESCGSVPGRTERKGKDVVQVLVESTKPSGQ
eukprot:INCI6641.1.p1 GENE.INCI6641.1~~INCI6641.1.p1  ORF type:complete len:307 (+),score=57.12 INCI6641.1:138-1058(+)